jgi:hypothetical protein
MNTTPGAESESLIPVSLSRREITLLPFNIASFPSYFYTLTQISPQPSPQYSRRNPAATKSFQARISLSLSVSRGI